MSQPPSDPPRALPRWLVVTGSVVIAAHLLAVGALVLAAPSGPWFVPQAGIPDMALPPQFAAAVNDVTAPNYLFHVKLIHNYHFASNRTGLPGATLTVRVKDRNGKVLKTLKLPDENANPWIRHRQELLARALADDVPQMPPEGVRLAAVGGKEREVKIWMPESETTLRLHTLPEHKLHRVLHDLREQKKLPPNENLARPSDWALLLAHSYARHLCHEYDAAKAELIRTTQMPVSPAVLMLPGPQSGPPSPMLYPRTLTANFGELPR
jgi:hypothetical protein